MDACDEVRGRMVREFHTVSDLERASCIKEDLGNVITSFSYLKSFHLKRGLYLSCVVPEGRSRISEQEFQGSSFQLKVRHGPLNTETAHNGMHWAAFFGGSVKQRISFHVSETPERCPPE